MCREQPGQQIRRETLWETTYQSQPCREVRRGRRLDEFTYWGELPAHDSAIGNQRHRIRSEEHTSELQSPCNLVCRLLLEKKKTTPRLRSTDATSTARSR